MNPVKKSDRTHTLQAHIALNVRRSMTTIAPASRFDKSPKTERIVHTTITQRHIY